MPRKNRPESLLPSREVLTVAQQWELVQKLRADLSHSADSLAHYKGEKWSDRNVDDGEYLTPNQALADLEHTWRNISTAAPVPPLFANREPPLADDGVRIAGTPLEALVTYLACGYYPPPELLLAVRHAVESYFDGEGQRELEECFFGRPRRKAGNHAARRVESHTEKAWAFEILVARKHGCSTDLAAAEEIVARYNLSIDPESVLRRARKHWTRVKPEE